MKAYSYNPDYTARNGHLQEAVSQIYQGAKTVISLFSSMTCAFAVFEAVAEAQKSAAAPFLYLPVAVKP